MLKTRTRTAGATLAGVALAAAGIALASTSASAATNWSYSWGDNLTASTYTPGQPVTYAVGLAPDSPSTVTAAHLTLTLPQGVTFDSVGGVKILQANTGNNAATCTIMTPTSATCDWAGTPFLAKSIADGQVNGQSLVISAKVIVDPSASGPVTAASYSGTITTQENGVSTTVGNGGKIELPTVVDTPVIAPAAAAIALLGAAGVGGGLLVRRRRAAASAQ